MLSSRFVGGAPDYYLALAVRVVFDRSIDAPFHPPLQREFLISYRMRETRKQFYEKVEKKYIKIFRLSRAIEKTENCESYRVIL